MVSTAVSCHVFLWGWLYPTLYPCVYSCILSCYATIPVPGGYFCIRSCILTGILFHYVTCVLVVNVTSRSVSWWVQLYHILFRYLYPDEYCCIMPCILMTTAVSYPELLPGFWLLQLYPILFSYLYPGRYYDSIFWHLYWIVQLHHVVLPVSCYCCILSCIIFS